MIAITDLRINNLVSWRTGESVMYFTVDRINKNSDCIVVDRSRYGQNRRYFSPSQLSPISLTPEILEKCGFEKDTESQYGGWLSPPFLYEQLRIRKDALGYYYQSHESFVPIYMASLHQLQNFYYCFTNTELTITI